MIDFLRRWRTSCWAIMVADWLIEPAEFPFESSLTEQFRLEPISSVRPMVGSGQRLPRHSVRASTPEATNSSAPGTSTRYREVRAIIGDWRYDYNANRPHSHHAELTPTKFGLQRTTTHQPQATVITGAGKTGTNSTLQEPLFSGVGHDD